MDTFLHVGKSHLCSLTFRPVQDGSFSYEKCEKPKGGLWLTSQEKANKTGNEWVEYLSWHPHFLVYKNYLNYNNTLDCLLVKLKNTARIFQLDNIDKLTYLKNKYPGPNLFSYEALSQDYDGIYIDIFKFYNYPIYQEYFQYFAVNTLLLFNYQCIEYYNPGQIIIDDLNENYEFNCYHINIMDSCQEIKPIPPEFITFQKEIATFLAPYLKVQENPQLNHLYWELVKLIRQNYAQEIEQFAHDANITSQRLTLSLIDNTLIKFK